MLLILVRVMMITMVMAMILTMRIVMTTIMTTEEEDNDDECMPFTTMQDSMTAMFVAMMAKTNKIMKSMVIITMTMPNTIEKGAYDGDDDNCATACLLSHAFLGLDIVVEVTLATISFHRHRR